MPVYVVMNVISIADLERMLFLLDGKTLPDNRQDVTIRLMEYNNERPHESLNNLTPEEYRLMAEKPELSKSAWN